MAVNIATYLKKIQRESFEKCLLQLTLAKAETGKKGRKWDIKPRLKFYVIKLIKLNFVSTREAILKY